MSGTLNETRFVLRDYLDPVAILTAAGVVDERYGYDAFGPVRVMDANFATRSSSTCAWNWLYHGEFLDGESGMYDYGYRFYHPTLGRWPSRDPIGERGGLNLYGFVGNDLLNQFDILGLKDLRTCCKGVDLAGRIGAAEALKNTLSRPPEHQVEYCGRICCPKNGGSAYTTGPVEGTRHSCNPRTPDTECDDGDIEVGIYHSHPGQDDFSYKDYDALKEGESNYIRINGETRRITRPFHKRNNDRTIRERSRPVLRRISDDGIEIPYTPVNNRLRIEINPNMPTSPNGGPIDP